MVKIIKVHTVIHPRHRKQSWLWKRLHQAKMLSCKHDSIEPTIKDASYWSGIEYAECLNCEALLEIKKDGDE